MSLSKKVQSRKTQSNYQQYFLLLWQVTEQQKSVQKKKGRPKLQAMKAYNGGAAFESENGGRIDVNYYYSGNDDTEPVYNEYENDVSAYFTEDKIDYNIYGTDTGREPVEEVVNSIK